MTDCIINDAIKQKVKIKPSFKSELIDVVENTKISKFVKKKPLLSKAFETRELFSLEKVLTLKTYYQDIITELRQACGDNHVKFKQQSSKYTKRLKVVQSMLRFPENSFWVENENFITAHTYGFNREGDFSRLYSSSSKLNILPREIRFYLFKDIYTDVDIVNSGPTIMTEFCAQENLDVPTLRAYVNNRESFLEVLCKDLNIKRDRAKKRVNMSLNAKKPINSKSQLLNLLQLEAGFVRITLAKWFKREHPELLKLWAKADKPVDLTSAYCGKRESEMLIKLRKFLIKQLEDNDHYKNPFIMKDYTEGDLYFIPFFDGAYIYHSNFAFKKRIPGLVETFNKITKSSGSNVKFVIKPIENTPITLVESRLQKYEQVCFFVHRLAPRELYALTKFLRVDDFKVPEELVLEFSKERKERITARIDIKKKLQALSFKAKNKPEEFTEEEELEVQALEKELNELPANFLFTPSQVLKLEELVENYSWNFRQKLLPFTETSDGLNLVLEQALQSKNIFTLDDSELDDSFFDVSEVPTALENQGSIDSKARPLDAFHSILEYLE